MKYSGPSIVTPKQVGQAAVVIENDILRNVTIVKTESIKVGIANPVIYYYTSEFPGKRFPAAEVFTDAAAAKTYFDSLDAI